MKYKSLRNSSPYVQQERIHYLELLKNKEKWIDKKGFQFHLGTVELEKKLEIPNYVRQSPSKYNPNLYQFRELDKKKFVGKGDFIYKNSRDIKEIVL